MKQLSVFVLYKMSILFGGSFHVAQTLGGEEKEIKISCCDIYVEKYLQT